MVSIKTIAVALIALATLTQVSWAADEGDSVQLPQTVDFSAGILDEAFTTFSTPLAERSGFADSYLRQMQKLVGEGIPTRALAPGEEKVLGVWTLPNGGATMLLSVLTRVSTFHETHGRLPQNGSELFPACQTDSGLAELATADAPTLVNLYADGISPITGRFISSFSAHEWQAGAMDITFITDPAEIETLMPGWRMPVDPADPLIDPTNASELRPLKRLVKVKVWGETPGSVLYESTWMN